MPSVRILGFALLLITLALRAGAEEFTNAIQAFLKHRGDLEQTVGAIVVGLVDEDGSHIVSYGSLDNGTNREVDGDTVFAIYSGSCRFTGILLEDMIERGQMKLDDPVAMYLPQTVKVPTRNVRQITLRHLLTETSGLPSDIANLDPSRADNPLADFTLGQMYDFLSGAELIHDPGSFHFHGGVDIALLGQIIALKAGTNYESLLVDRICAPLKMDSTRTTLTPELKARCAAAHPTQSGFVAANLDWGIFAPLGGIYSTPNDLLKFLSASLGLTPSRLAALTEHYLVPFPDSPERDRGIVPMGGGNKFMGHFSAFDKNHRRGVVVLSSSGNGLYNAQSIGEFLLASEWEMDRRPQATNLSPQAYAAYAGLYQRAPDVALGLFSLRHYFQSAPKAVFFRMLIFGLVLLSIILWRAGSPRGRCIILGCTALAVVVVAALAPFLWSRGFCARFQPRIGIHVEGDRVFAQASSVGLWPVADWEHAPAGDFPIDQLWPPLPLELKSQSETRFFERLSGMPVMFSRDGAGRIARLTVLDQGREFAYEKISDEPPTLPEPPRRPIAIKLDARQMDACVGKYEQASCAAFPAGVKVAVWREGNQLLWRPSGQNSPEGTLEIYPESETNFFIKPGGTLTFIKNEHGDVTTLTFHGEGLTEGLPKLEARRIGN